MTRCSYQGTSLGQIDCGCERSNPDVELFACDHPSRRTDVCVQIGGGDALAMRDVRLDDVGRRTITVQSCSHCPLAQRSDSTSPGGFAGRENPQQRAMRLRRVERQRPLGPAEVLVAVGGKSPINNGIRGGHACDVLADAGISATYAELGDYQATATAIETTGARVVINRGFVLAAEVVTQLAARFTNTRFVTVNHSSNTWTASVTKWARAQSDFLALAREHENCFYATVTEHDPVRDLSGVTRAIWLPNAVRIPARQSKHVGKSIDGPVTVSIVCRHDVLKAVGSQIVGAAIANKRRTVAGLSPIKLAIRVSQPAAELVRYASDVGLEARLVAWGDWQDFTRFVCDEVHVGLQVTNSDSFNFIALEHMLCGVPVVTSWPIRYGHRHLRAHPENVAEIADRLIYAIGHHAAESERALWISNRVAERNNERLVATMRRLLER